MPDTNYAIYLFSRDHFTGNGNYVLPLNYPSSSDWKGATLGLDSARQPDVMYFRDDDATFSSATDPTGQVSWGAELNNRTLEITQVMTLKAADGATYPLYIMGTAGENDKAGIIISKDLAGYWAGHPDEKLEIVDFTQHDTGSALYSDIYQKDMRDGVVDGTSGADSIGPGYNDFWNDKVDGADNTGAAGGVPNSDDDVIKGYGGNDTIAAGAGNDTVYGGDGSDSIDGGAGNDSLQGWGDFADGTDDGAADTLSGGPGDDTLLGGGGDDSLSGGDGNDLLVGGAGRDTLDGGAGNDVIYGDTKTPNDGVGTGDSILGGAGSDTIYGGAGNDTIDGGKGNDSITGNLGNDLIHGGEGNDTINGGGTGDPANQADTIYGDGGNDYIDANIGDDLVYGGTGNDTIVAGAGKDTVEGGDGNDAIYGNNGDDLLKGEGGNDFITGGLGSDTIFGGDGDDTILGGTSPDDIDDANDSIEGGAGNDSIDGGAGNDTLFGEEGHDRITGNLGDDYLHGGDGDDTLDGGAGDDQLWGGAGANVLIGGLGNDMVNGGDDAETLIGGDGDDLIDGWGGDDFIDGGAGNDTVTGGNGSDSILGGAGDDALLGGADDGNDTLDGGDGNDFLMGEAGDDLAIGGAGNDTIIATYGSDTMTGGEGFDTFVVIPGEGPQDNRLITDFNTATGQDFKDHDQSNNDFVDLSGFYNRDSMDAYNAAHGTHYKSPLEWMRADQSDDGILNQPDGLNLTVQNGGTAVAARDLTWDNTNVCFAADAMIETDRGPVRAGDLAVGDLVVTRDAGLQPIRWTGRRDYTRAQLDAEPQIRPIRIARGALGGGLPTADLLVSPQHRVLVRSAIAQKMFGTDEVLVAAKQLILLDGIDVANREDGVTYVHFLFDAHQIVFSNGAETESLYTGTEALRSVGEAARNEIFAIFPELRDRTDAPVAARTLASGRMGRKLAVRHANNRKPLVS